MLLRRITAHVKRQDWVAVAIDFVIVVVGVFIGIQVANWNDAAREEARASDYLARILGDLEADGRRLQSRVEYWSAVASLGRRAIAHAEGADDEDASAWPILIAYYQASQFNPYNATNTTYEELKSAGELGLIRNAPLRADLAAYYRKSAERTEALYGLNPEYRRLVRGLTPMPVQDYIWNECYRVEQELDEGFKDCPAPISEGEVRAIVDELAADRELVVELRFWVSNLSVNLALAEAEIAQAGALADRARALLSEAP